MKRRSPVTKKRSGTDLPGIGLHALADLETSLEQMTALYEENPRQVREHVIQAKDRARWASQNQKATEEQRAVKAEMVDWMLVWLDDPSMFHAWVKLRLAAMSETSIKCDVCGGSGHCTTCKGTSNGGQCFNCAGTGNCPQCQGTGKRKVS